MFDFLFHTDAKAPVADHAHTAAAAKLTHEGNSMTGAQTAPNRSPEQSSGHVVMTDPYAEAAAAKPEAQAKAAEHHQEHSFFGDAANWVAGAADIAGHAIAGAVEKVVEEVEKDPLGAAIHVAEGVAIGAAVIAAAPIVGALGASAAVVAGVAVAADVAMVGLGVVGVAQAATEVSHAADKTGASADVLMHKENHTQAEIDKARQDIEKNCGTAAISVATAAAGVAGGVVSGAKVIAAVRGAGEAAAAAGEAATVTGEVAGAGKAAATGDGAATGSAAKTGPSEARPAQGESAPAHSEARPARSENPSEKPAERTTERAAEIPQKPSMETTFTPGELTEIAEMERTQASMKVLKLTSEEVEAEAAARYAAETVRQEKVLDIVIGPPGSLKSSALVEPLQAERGARVIDSDPIKLDLPGYADGLGADAVHKASSEIAVAILGKALRNGDNIVLPKLGATPESLETLIAVAKERGYKVNLHLADVPPEVSARRSFDRAFRKPDGSFGQWVNPAKAFEVGYGPQITFEELITRPGLISEFNHFNTNIPRGAEPILVKTSKWAKAA